MPKIKPVIRVVLNRKSSKKLIRQYIKGEIEWSDKSLKNLKSVIRKLLRREQQQKCPYCQRVISLERRNAAEDIEHFLDKSKAHYRHFAFSATNIVLACHACNLEKGTIDLGCPAVRAATYLIPTVGVFSWPHPYYDDMAECVEKLPGPVYKPIQGSGKESQAAQMISDLKLDNIRNMESRMQILRDRLDEIHRLQIIEIRKGAGGNQRFLLDITEEAEMICAEIF